MTDTIRLPDELGRLPKTRREADQLSKKELAARAGKVREVIYRLEAGEDVTVSSLMAVLGALGLGMRIEKVVCPRCRKSRHGSPKTRKTEATTPMLPEKIPQLDVAVAGQVIKRSTCEFRYRAPRPRESLHRLFEQLAFTVCSATATDT